MLGSGSVQCSQSQQLKLGAGELRRPRQASSQVCVSLSLRPYSFLQCYGILLHAVSHSADTGLFLGRGCCVFFLCVCVYVCACACASRSLHGSAGQRVLVNTHSQRRRICRKTSSLTARQLAHTSKMFALRQIRAEPPPPPPLLVARRGCALAAARAACISWG